MSSVLKTFISWFANVPHDKLRHAIAFAFVYGAIRLPIAVFGGHLLPGWAINILAASVAVGLAWLWEDYEEAKGIAPADYKDIVASAAGVALAVFCSWPGA